MTETPTETPTLTTDEDAPGPVIQRGSLALTLRRLRRDTAAMVALAVIVLVVALAVFAPAFTTLTGHSAIVQFRDSGLSPTQRARELIASNRHDGDEST